MTLGSNELKLQYGPLLHEWEQQMEDNTDEEVVTQPQAQLPHYPLSMRELRAERHRYLFIPEFQRGIVWGPWKSKALVNTMLTGDYIPPLVGVKIFTDDGEVRWSLIDGFQRLTAVLGYMDGAYKTWTKRQKQALQPNSSSPIEPGKYFDQLSPRARNHFLDYQFSIVQVQGKSPRQLVECFKNTQNHDPLSAAEDLKADATYSKIGIAARCIKEHPFWEDFYDGHTDREQVFQTSLFLLALELAQPQKMFVDILSKGFIHRLACGTQDHVISEALVWRVLDKLDKICALYHGAHFTQRSIIVPMYQSVSYLENAGYTITEKDKGKLATWIMNVLAEAKYESLNPHFSTPIYYILREAQQKIFWDRHLKTIMGLFRLSFREEVDEAREDVLMGFNL